MNTKDWKKEFDKKYRPNRFLNGERLPKYEMNNALLDDMQTFISSLIEQVRAEERGRILSLAYSATLCDHMGDMWCDINKVLKDIGEKELVEADHEETNIFKERGIKTVWGTS